MNNPLSNYPEGVNDQTINEAWGEQTEPYIWADTKEEKE